MDQVSEAETVNVLLVTVLARKLAINNLIRLKFAEKYKKYGNRLVWQLGMWEDRKLPLQGKLENLLDVSWVIDETARFLNLDSLHESVLRVRNTRVLVIDELQKLLRGWAILHPDDGERFIREQTAFMSDEFDELQQITTLGAVVNAWIEAAYEHMADDNLTNAGAVLNRVLSRLETVQAELAR